MNPTRNQEGSTMSLAVRNLVFTLVVPVSGAVLAPEWVLRRFDPRAGPTAWPAFAVIAAGVALYLWCVWLFAAVGRGTPGPWDAPRRFVAVGPYRWVRNPIYVSALLVVLGEAWLFLSPPLLAYAGAMAIGSHLFVVGYEEPTLRRRFGHVYEDYLASVRRWIPRPPKRGRGPPLAGAVS
jgi:protein-S-isoprenylcysteine O-methyltransferase Ste14